MWNHSTYFLQYAHWKCRIIVVPGIMAWRLFSNSKSVCGLRIKTFVFPNATSLIRPRSWRMALVASCIFLEIITSTITNLVRPNYQNKDASTPRLLKHHLIFLTWFSDLARFFVITFCTFEQIIKNQIKYLTNPDSRKYSNVWRII